MNQVGNQKFDPQLFPYNQHEKIIFTGRYCYICFWRQSANVNRHQFRRQSRLAARGSFLHVPAVHHFDAIDKTAALGIKRMSLSGSVLLDKDAKPVGSVTLADKDMEAIKAKKISAGISWPFVNIGVVQLTTNEVQSRKVFEFAKKWGIDPLVSEPETTALDTVEKLCKEYNIKVAIHDHPKGHSIYWNPDFVLAAIKGRTPFMGACA